MNHPLSEQFKEICSELPTHALNNLLTVAQCMCLARSTNLAKAKDYVSQVLGYTEENAVQPQSHYQRLIRFFDQAVKAEQDGGFYYGLGEAIHQISLGVLGSLPPGKSSKLRVLILHGTKIGQLHEFASYQVDQFIQIYLRSDLVISFSHLIKMRFATDFQRTFTCILYTRNCC